MPRLGQCNISSISSWSIAKRLGSKDWVKNKRIQPQILRQQIIFEKVQRVSICIKCVFRQNFYHRLH